MTISIYATRSMAAPLREIKPVHGFLRGKFFSVDQAYRTENVDIDVQVQGRRVAPFVSRYAPGKIVDRLGFETSSVAPPCIAMKMPITAEDVSTRVMGEHVYENRSPEQRAQELLVDDLKTMTDMKERRLEMMARDAIFTLSGNNSRVTASGDNTTMTFDFPRNSALQIGTLGGTAAWDNAASDPIAKLHEWAELYAKVSGMVATDVIFGGTAWQTFIANAKVIAKLSSLTQINFGAIAPQVPDGARLQGALYGGGLRLWTYHEWYDDPDNSGTTTEMVPAKKIVMASDRLRTEMRYGAIQTLTDENDPNAMPTLVAVPVLARSWVEKDPPVRYLELRSRPLPVPIQNHFLTVQVQA